MTPNPNTDQSDTETASKPHPARRDFLYIATAATGVVALGGAAWPLVNQMNPSADVMAVNKVDVDLADVPLGARVTVKWHGKPIFIDHRPEKRIALAVADDHSPTLLDPATDAERVQRPEWLVVIGICTHLGCIPLGQANGDPRGKWDGWFCPCHGSVYDTAGRVRRGPAPLNLYLPPYKFLTDTQIRIG